MIKYSNIFIIFLVFVFSATCFAQEPVVLNVEEISICTAVEDRQPVGVDSVFMNDVGKLYCFTKITGEADTTTISHIWYHNDKEMAKLDLSVKSKSWRTWSSKNIIEYWVGDWRVDVTDEQGKVLATALFTVKKPELE